MENAEKCECCGKMIPKDQQLCSDCKTIVDKFCEIPTVNPITAEELRKILARYEQKKEDENG